MVVCALVIVSLIATAPPTRAALAPARLAGSLDVFPVRGPCQYTDTFGAARGLHRRHEGVDIFATRGQPVYAVRDGWISKKYFNAPRSGFAIQITVMDGTYFFYAHLAGYAPGMKKGRIVHAGQVIGYVGSTGNAAFPHLHFEVHPRGGRAVDPIRYLRAVDACHTSRPPTTITEPPTVPAPTGTGTGASPGTATVGAEPLHLTDTTLRANVTSRVSVGPAGPGAARIMQAELVLAVSHGPSRGALILGDCSRAGRAVLAVVPGRTTVTTKLATLGPDGRICVTSTVDSHVSVAMRRAWTSDGRQLVTTKRQSAFDSAQTGRYPSPSSVFKVRLDGAVGLPAHIAYVLARLTVKAARGVAVDAGVCGNERQTVATVSTGSSVRVTALVRLGGGDLCIGATGRAAVHVDVVGYG